MTISNDGINITIRKPPERIISLAPSNTEILFALGLGEKVVAVTEYDNYPEEATRKELIGGFKTVNIEKVVFLNPDLILATGGIQLEIVEKLRELDLAVVIIDAKDFEGIFDNIRLVGKITDSENEVKSLVDTLSERVQEIEERKSDETLAPRVMYVIWGDPLMVAGPDAFANDIIELAGGENIFADALIQYPTVSFESVIERDPEVIIFGGHKAYNSTGFNHQAGWEEISAVKNNRVHTINADIVSRQGPRIVDALELFSLWMGGDD
jgi:iron complex transport system substrate-binding protein